MRTAIKSFRINYEDFMKAPVNSIVSFENGTPSITIYKLSDRLVISFDTHGSSRIGVVNSNHSSLWYITAYLDPSVYLLSKMGELLL